MLGIQYCIREVVSLSVGRVILLVGVNEALFEDSVCERVFQSGTSIAVDKLLEIFKKAFCYRTFSRAQWECRRVDLDSQSLINLHQRHFEHIYSSDQP